jgi:tape measure domain-containing protein
VQVEFDRRSVQNELNALQANIRRRNYRLNIETNLSAEIAKADTLARKLTELSGKIKPAAVSGASSGKRAIADIEEVLRGGLTGKAFGIQQAQENIARQAILSRLEKKSLSAGGYNVKGLEKIIRDLGGTPTGGRTDLVAQAKKLVEEADGVSDAVFNNLKDLQMKLRPIRGQAQTSAPRSMPNLNEMLDRMANLTSNPRAAQRMLRMMPESRITTDLIGAANRQAAFQQQFPEGFSLPGFNAPKAFDPLLKAIAKDFTDYAKSVNISDPWVGQIGNGIAGIVAKAATSPQAQKLLPAAGQTSATRFNPNITRPIFAAAQAAQAGGGQRFSFANRIGSLGQFPMAGMMGPSTPLSINARTSMFGGGGMQPPGGGGGGGAGGFGGFGRALGGVPNLPGSGIIRELGSEFAFAAKQVVLFGQAYKLLAFIQDFPAQIGAAVGQLQSFRNTLNTIAPTAEEVRASNELILDLMNRYNVPLQSARDGFTKLYASMAPAGFSGDEIRELFTGITKAAATFGMSADKVDRVNYAFAQMASKGQVMSEELKGQLGDVLPGAMALFAEAAGFEGPKAIQDFSAALEDGAYKGEAMVALLKNVGIVMNKEFGPGAEGAARTFQGVINRMQNSMILLYESFEPVAVGFLNTVVAPMTDGIKQLSDGLNAFFTGAAAKTAGGFAISQELEKLRPAFIGIKENATALTLQLGDFAKVALEVGKILLQIAGNPIVGYLARLYAIALPINIALNAMRGLWAANAVQLLIFNTRVATGTSTLTAFRGMMAATGATAQATAASIRTAGITLRSFFATTGVGLVVVGISMLIEKFLSMNQALEDTKNKALGAAQAIRSMSQTEARMAEQQAQTAYQTIGVLAGRKGQQQPGGDRLVPVSERELKQLQSLGAIREQRDPSGQIYVRRSEALSLASQAQRLQTEAAFRQRQIKFDEQQANMPAVLGAIPPGEEDGKTKKGKELDTYIADATKLFAQQKENLLLGIEEEMLLGKISETEAKRRQLLIEKLYEEKAVREALRIAQLKANEANLSAADKELKKADLKKQSDLELANITKKYGVEVLKVQLGLEEPLKNAIANTTAEMDKQAMVLAQVDAGFTELSYDQKAYLDALALTKDMSEADQIALQDKILELRRLREEYYKNEEVLKKRLTLLEAQTELESIGTGLMSGYIGPAASRFESALIESRGDVDYATKLADIETKAMQMRSVFEGIQGAIDGISGAFASMMTEGVTALITGTATAKEVFASFLQSVAQALQQAAAQMIATYIAIGLARIFAGLGSKGADPLKGVGGADWMKYTSAKGSYFDGPTAFFADGGIVSSPTFFQFADGGKINMGLMGEAGPEAIMPLKRGPDGRLGISMYDASRKAVANAESNAGISSIDYEDEASIGASSSSRQALSSKTAQAALATRLQVMEQRSISEKRSELRQIQEMVAAPAKINVEYQSQVINNVEYVTRDQAERMASQSALRGRELALGALQNSVKARKRVGMG